MIGSKTAVLLLLSTAACGNPEAPQTDEANIVATNQSEFAAFAQTVYREPDTGMYVVDGDRALGDIKQLEEFWQLHVQNGDLIVNQSNGHDTVWPASQKRNLTYCVNQRAFGGHYAAVVQAIADASDAWAAVADVAYVHDASQDSNCTANSNVVFDVNPVNVHGQYIARSFFPNTPRAQRNVLIDNSAFQSSGDPTLTGVLRHELGHTLGFRHEHTRPEAGTCFEDTNWRQLTAYDQASVMHYPQCNGTSSWALELTAKDAAGAALLYGAAAGAPAGAGGGDTNGGGNNGGGQPSNGPTTQSFQGSVARGKWATVNPDGGFSVAPSTQVIVAMTGTGDPDLYVRFDSKPAASAYDCRPYLSSANETCTIDVPAGATTLFVAARGYAAGTFQIDVTYTAN